MRTLGVLAAGVLILVAAGCGDSSTSAEQTTATTSAEATGKELPGANTALYKISAEQANEIEWSDQDALSNVDWSTYRKACQQASE